MFIAIPAGIAGTAAPGVVLLVKLTYTKLSLSPVLFTIRMLYVVGGGGGWADADSAPFARVPAVIAHTAIMIIRVRLGGADVEPRLNTL